jgi:hypothetical protein
METLNNKYLAFAILAGFAWLCLYAYHYHPLTLPTAPVAQQTGYNKRDIARLDRFVEKHVADVKYTEAEAVNLISLFGKE